MRVPILPPVTKTTLFLLRSFSLVSETQYVSTRLHHKKARLMAATTKKDPREQVEIPTRQPPDFQPSVEPSTFLVLGDRTRMRPFSPRRHEVRNVIYPVWGRSAELVFSEIMRVREPIEWEMEDSGDLDLGQR